MKPQDLGEMLAYALVQKTTREEDIDYLKQLFPNMKEVDLFKESIAYELFLMIMACELFFKENKDGPKTAEVLTAKLASRLIENGIFNDYKEYMSFMKSRTELYNADTRENKEPNYIYWLGKHFCAFCGDDSDLSKFMMISSAFPDSLKANLELLTNLTHNTGKEQK